MLNKLDRLIGRPFTALLRVLNGLTGRSNTQLALATYFAAFICWGMYAALVFHHGVAGIIGSILQLIMLVATIPTALRLVNTVEKHQENGSEVIPVHESEFRIWVLSRVLFFCIAVVNSATDYFGHLYYALYWDASFFLQSMALYFLFTFYGKRKSWVMSLIERVVGGRRLGEAGA